MNLCSPFGFKINNFSTRLILFHRFDKRVMIERTSDSKGLNSCRLGPHVVLAPYKTPLEISFLFKIFPSSEYPEAFPRKQPSKGAPAFDSVLCCALFVATIRTWPPKEIFLQKTVQPYCLVHSMKLFT